MARFWSTPFTILEESGSVGQVLLGLTKIILLLPHLNVLVPFYFAINPLLYGHVGVAAQLQLSGVGILAAGPTLYLFLVSIRLNILTCIIDRLEVSLLSFS